MTLSPKCPNERYREVVSQCLPTPVKVKDKANILLQNAGSGCQILQSKGLMYKVFEGAHFTPSNYQCFLLRVFKLKLHRTDRTDVEILRIELRTSSSD